MITREAGIFWKELRMRKKIDAAVAAVRAEYSAGSLTWTYKNVQSLIGAYPARGQLDQLLPGQEDEATPDETNALPWEEERAEEEEEDAAKPEAAGGQGDDSDDPDATGGGERGFALIILGPMCPPGLPHGGPMGPHGPSFPWGPHGGPWVPHEAFHVGPHGAPHGAPMGAP